MNIKRLLKSHSRGQSLAFVAVISIALFGILALALDFGYTLYNRRWAQNAADSGALAAARVLCTDVSINRYTNATNAAQEYVEDRNLAFGVISQQMTQICIYGDPNPPAGCAGASLDKGQAEVTVSIEHPTFVASFFGTNSITVPAVAQAGCFAPGGIKGPAVVPVAWECDSITCTTIEENDPATEEDDVNVCTCGGLNYTTSPTCILHQDPMYIFFDQPKNEYYWCTEWGPTPPTGTNGEIAIPIKCDDPNTPVFDVTPISPLNPDHKWFWVDIDGDGCSTQQLTSWIENGLVNLDMNVHEWYQECTGNRAAAYTSMGEARPPGTRLLLPVFDRQCQTANSPYSPLAGSNLPACQAGPNGTAPPLAMPDTEIDTQSGGDGNGQTNWYHMSGAAVLRLQCVTHKNVKCNDKNKDARGWLESLPANKARPKDNYPGISNEPSFEGCFLDEYVPGLFGRPSDGVVTGAWTIYLVK